MSKKLTTEEFIKKSKEIYKDKFSYNNVNYVDNNTKVKLWCNDHNGFIEQTPHQHLRGNGCKVCADKEKGLKYRSNTEEFIEKANKVHNNKYDYSKVNYTRSCEEVEIICPNCNNSFYQTPNNHLLGHGCPKCCDSGVLLTTEEFIEKANKVHNNKYDYSKVNYINAITPVEIICNKCNLSFWQTPHSHLSGSGCPMCKCSKLEEETRLFLIGSGLDFKEQFTWDWLVYKRNQFVDFYIPEFNAAIECQGIQHFSDIKFFGNNVSFEDRLDKDKNKSRLCTEHGINLFYYSNIIKNGYDKQYKLSSFTYPYKVFEDLNELFIEIKKLI